MAKPKKRCDESDCKWYNHLLAFGRDDENRGYYLPEHCATCINLYRNYDNYEQKGIENGKTRQT